ncbi:MAG: sulfatase [Planctomycetaceae bacterium]|nr:sulfatase [Planctomycetaceae bacterium]
MIACVALLGSVDRTIAAKHVLLICVDDLRPELRVYGVDYIESPHIDGLAAQGRFFTRHYVQAPTCGASRYALLTGTYGPRGNNALFERAKRMHQADASVSPSMPEWFRGHGYTTVSVGKVSHHPGGRGGADWDDDTIIEMPGAWDRHLLPAGDWQHPRGAMHGLAHGEIRGNAKQMDVFQSEPGDDSIYPDGLITTEGIRQLKELTQRANGNPFFLAVGIIRPHLPFGAPAKYMEPYRDAVLPAISHPEKPKGKTTWHGSGEFMKYNRWGRDPNEDAEFATLVRRHYAACVSYADAQVGKILTALDESGLRDETVVVLWGDHGWHLGEHAVWGKHTLFEESLRSPLIIQHQSIPRPGEGTNAVVETIDLFPTLCALTGLPMPDFVDGTSLIPLLRDPQATGHSAIAYHGRAQTIRTDRYRLITHKDGDVEFYDHSSSKGETANVATDHSQIVKRLTQELEERLKD